VLTSERIYDHCLFVVEAAGETVKVEFAPLYFPRLHPAEERSGVLVDSLEDIAANKILALADRFDPKDFVDVHFLCRHQGWSILDLVAIARRKHDAPYEYSLRLSRIVEQGPSLAAVLLVRPLAAEEFVDFFRSAEAQLVRAQQARLASRRPSAARARRLTCDASGRGAPWTRSRRYRVRTAGAAGPLRRAGRRQAAAASRARARRSVALPSRRA